MSGVRHVSRTELFISGKLDNMNVSPHQTVAKALFRVHCKNIRISTDILCRVFYMYQTDYVSPGLIIPSIYGYKHMRNRFG